MTQNDPTAKKLLHEVRRGPLAALPPSAQEWKKQGGRGEPPVAYELVVRSADNTALEYEVYHGFISYVTPRAIERRIVELTEDRAASRKRYNKAAIYYLKKKLEEMITGREIE